MHWMNKEEIERMNTKIVLSKVEDLEFEDYDITTDSNGDLVMKVEDPKSGGLANVFINLTKGMVEEVNTGIIKYKEHSWSHPDEDYEDCLNYSRRIVELASIERELLI